MFKAIQAATATLRSPTYGQKDILDVDMEPTIGQMKVWLEKARLCAVAWRDFYVLSIVKTAEPDADGCYHLLIEWNSDAMKARVEQEVAAGTLKRLTNWSATRGFLPPSTKKARKVVKNATKKIRLCGPTVIKAVKKVTTKKPNAMATLAALASPADDSLIVVLSLESGERRVVARGGFYGRYVSTGHLLYAVGNSVRAIAFDPDQLEVSGSPVPVVEDVVTKTLGAANFSVADNGSLAYVPGTTALRDVTRQLVWVDREGRETILDAVPAPYESPRISPDGRYVAVQTVGDNPDVVVYDLERNTTTRLTFDSGYDGNPTWSPDGEDILFNSNRTGQGNIFRKPADGTGQVEQLTDYDVPVFLDQMTPDGDNVLMSINRGNFDLQLMPLQDLPAETSQALVATEFNEGVSAISPDGQWIAYQSNESGEFEVYVRPFPNVDDGRWQISQNGGVGPLWGPTGEELFYQQAGSAVIMSVDVDTESSFRPGNPEILFSGDYRPYSPNSGRSFDLSPDGRRFLLLTDDQNGTIAGETGRIVLVQNWFEELKERVPVP